MGDKEAIFGICVNKYWLFSPLDSSRPEMRAFSLASWVAEFGAIGPDSGTLKSATIPYPACQIVSFTRELPFVLKTKSGFSRGWCEGPGWTTIQLIVHRDLLTGLERFSFLFWEIDGSVQALINLECNFSSLQHEGYLSLIFKEPIVS